MTGVSGAARVLIAEGLADGVFPGAALVVGDAGRRVVELVAGRKSLGGAPVGPATLFDVASLTKPLVTALLALRLVEDGTLGWDDAAPIPGVTLRHLLTHSSGLPAWRPLHEGGGGRAAIALRARQAVLERAPGSASVYSDLGFIVLGDVIERAAGQRLDRLARSVDLEAADRPGDVAATESVPAGEVHDENCHAAGGVLGHAGLFANGDDVARLVEALLAGFHGDAGAPFRRDLVQALWTPCDVPGSTWRLGWDGPAAHGSSAGTLWPRSGVGHLGFTGCSVWVDPPRRRYVILLSNRVHPTRGNDRIKAFRPRLHDGIVSELRD